MSSVHSIWPAPVMPLERVHVLWCGEAELQQNPVNDDETVGRDDDDMLFHKKYPFQLEFHDEAQGIVGRAIVECGGYCGVRVAVVSNCVRVARIADSVSVARIGNTVGMRP